jgi:RNA polymerase sigma factor (sigma-70 family)
MDTYQAEPELADGVDPPAAADNQLLRQFVATRDEQAFGELVRRHSGLVLGVCRRTLRDEHDAEEAFQATFLVLAAKAARIRAARTVGPWLYGVAYRIAIRAAAKRVRRREAALPDDLVMIEDALKNVAECHWQRVLDDEINLLPEKYRGAVVLHYLIGKTNKQVAAELGLSERTVEGRQRRGKELLKRRLMLRGVTLPLALGAVAATTGGSAAAAEPLVEATIEAGMSFVHGNCAACSAHAVRLAQSEVLAMNSSMAPLSATLLTLFALGGGLAIAGGDARVHGGGSPPVAAVVQLAATTDASPENNQLEEPGSIPVQLAVAEEPATPPAAEQATTPAEAADASGLDGINRNEERIVTALKSRVRAPFDFMEQPLRDVAAFLSDEYGFPVMIDQPALDAVGASPDLPVSLQVQNVSLKSALNLMLKNSAIELSYIVDDEVLLITTVEQAEAHLEPVVYDLTEITSLLGTNVEEIAKIISETVARDAWEVNGTGEGTMQPLSKQYLVISQSQSVHDKIVKLLVQMQQKAEAAE